MGTFKENYILRPELRRCMINEGETEDAGDAGKESAFHYKKMEYLEIPDEVDEDTLRTDIRKGAAHLKEVLETLSKDKENRKQYFVIDCEEKEDGLLAVSYLAACYRRREEQEEMPAYDFPPAPEDSFMEPVRNEPVGGKLNEWVENPYQMPVLDMNEVYDILDRSDIEEGGFGGFRYQQQRLGDDREPYWFDLEGEESVCIVHGGGALGGVFPSQVEFECLDFFSEYKRVYFVCISSHKENRGLGFMSDDFMFSGNLAVSPRMGLVLHFAAEDISVVMAEDKKTRYFGHVFREMLSRKGASLCRNFPVAQVIRQIESIQTKGMAGMLEKVIGYALRDVNVQKKPVELRKEDFAFLSRFADAWKQQGEQKNGKASKRMEQELVGLTQVKQDVRNVVQFLKYIKMREKMHLENGTYHNVHLMLGAPGTAKTTTARLMGEIMREEKLLNGDAFIYINGAELKGKYVGHTAPKVKAIFEEHDIIVIDEAYSLVEEGGEGDSFSREALAQLIIEIENHSTDKLIIFAGYGGKNVSEKDDRMKQFLDANPGIRSRITSTMYFPSYSEEEMVLIFEKIASLQHYKLEKGYQEIVRDYFAERREDRNFGNGREARSLLEICAMYAAKRVMSEEKKKYSRKELQMIQLEDIKTAIEKTKQSNGIREVNRARRMGFR